MQKNSICFGVNSNVGTLSQNIKRSTSFDNIKNKVNFQMLTTDFKRH